MQFNILFPVYNEENRIYKGICEAYEYFGLIPNFDFLITIINNASTDATEEIIFDILSQYPQVQYIKINEKGVGIAVKTGIIHSKSEVVGYMDIDLSTDVKYLKIVKEKFELNQNLQVINGSRFNKLSSTNGRKWYRNITSFGLVFFLKKALNMKSSDAICGFKFFKRKDILPLLEKCRDENGWFYIIELLIRAEREKYDIYELPVNWNDDAKNSSVKVMKTVRNYIYNIYKLRKSFK